MFLIYEFSITQKNLAKYKFPGNLAQKLEPAVFWSQWPGGSETYFWITSGF